MANHNETVTLVRKLRSGGETREVMPRWVAELTIGAIPLPDEEGEPNTASARIESLPAIEVNRTSPYPIRKSTPAKQAEIALTLAGFVTARLVA